MRILALSATIISVLFVGCETKAQTGALTGAGLGVGTGAIIGGGQGAVIGGAVGVVAGAAIGSALDNSDRDNLQKQSPRTLRKIDRGEPLSEEDIKEMSEAGLSDSTIIEQIKVSHSEFHLTTADIIDLKSAGVSQRVIDVMMQK